MSYNYVQLTFENVDPQRTEDIVRDLGDAGIGYEHITGKVGCLIGAVHKELNLDTFSDKAENVVHSHNDGMMFEAELVTYKSIEHLL